jgi:hypothetical protein
MSHSLPRESESLSVVAARVQQDGFALLSGVWQEDEIGPIRQQLQASLHPLGDSSAAIGARRGTVYAARNLIQLWPEVVNMARHPRLVDAVRQVLGPRFGLVRALYFDKPPGGSWALPWHRDRAIAVECHRKPLGSFRRPTTKAGVPHVDAPVELLNQMLTARIHLDPMTPHNGPLHVIGGSHRDVDAPATVISSATATPLSPETSPAHKDPAATTILTEAGDVFLMRPLLVHGSLSADEGTQLHRRIVHLEYAAVESPGEGFAWHDYLPCQPT